MKHNITTFSANTHNSRRINTINIVFIEDFTNYNQWMYY